MALTFLHFADLHLGVENYGRLDPATGLHTRIQDFSNSLGCAFDLAIEEEVDLVVFAGDAYKTCDPNPTHQREFARQLRRLQQASIPIVLIVGNHDTPAAFGKATSIDIFGALELDNTFVIRRPELLQIDTRNGPVQIAGLPWPTRNILRTHDDYKDLPQEEVTAQIQSICAAQIGEFSRQLKPEFPAILTAHIAAAEATYSGSERTALIGQDPTLLTSTLANPLFDYVALGHIHKYQDLHKGADPPVVYSGSLERIDFGEEREDKGFCIASIDEDANAPRGRTTSFEFVPVAARRFVTVELKIQPEKSPTDQIVAAIGASPIEDAVVRVLYDLPATIEDPVDLEPIRRALEPAFYIASIQPRMVPRERPRRATVTEDLGLQEALDRYIENNEHLDERREDLLRYALELEHQLELLEGEQAS
ncbi:MAG: exonuclease SbcD [Planctomycetota bacterium]|jgi:exonuclease SbcD